MTVLSMVFTNGHSSAAFLQRQKLSIPRKRVCIGDHDARVGLGYPFPAIELLPSNKDGFHGIQKIGLEITHFLG